VANCLMCTTPNGYISLYSKPIPALSNIAVFTSGKDIHQFIITDTTMIANCHVEARSLFTAQTNFSEKRR